MLQLSVVTFCSNCTGFKYPYLASYIAIYENINVGLLGVQTISTAEHHTVAVVYCILHTWYFTVVAGM